MPCTILPLPGHQASFQIDGVERLRWHFGADYPRPFFYPLLGPSGSSLTRMGHPGAANHDHHQSVWFAHNKVLGIDFWSNNGAARIRQKNWLVYEDRDDECAMAVLLGWYDGHDPRELLEQQLVVVMRPGDAAAGGKKQETLLELQSTFTPKSDTLEFGQTNFGFLAVRVAKNLSAHFGGGQLTDSDARRGEPNIFGKQAAWMDYSGPVPAGGVEGITYFDHSGNPGHPNHWHVREDGWMGASSCMHTPRETTKDAPLMLRYLLHVHGGDIDAGRAAQVAADFEARPTYRVEKSTAKHQQYEIVRT
ncbi:MAG: PmoA family protein [Pirellulaceae bacterium]